MAENVKLTCELEVFCEACGKVLEITQDRRDKITIIPCPDCLDEKYKEGYDCRVNEGES